MHPNLVGILVSAGILLSLFSRELFSFAMERINSRSGAGEKGAVSWAGPLQGKTRRAVMRCVKCGWMGHFDIKQWQELNRR
jgi:hypothetical protein